MSKYIRVGTVTELCLIQLTTLLSISRYISCHTNMLTKITWVFGSDWEVDSPTGLLSCSMTALTAAGRDLDDDEYEKWQKFLKPETPIRRLAALDLQLIPIKSTKSSLCLPRSESMTEQDFADRAFEWRRLGRDAIDGEHRLVDWWKGRACVCRVNGRKEEGDVDEREDRGKKRPKPPDSPSPLVWRLF